METPNSTAIQEFQSTALSHCLHPKITLPTRITSTSATIIDNIFSNFLDRDSIAKIIIDDISDHLPIYLSLIGCYCDSRNQVTHPLRIQSDANKMNFVNTLMKEDWSDVLCYCSKGDVTRAYSSFINRYYSSYDSCFPVASKRRTCCPYRKPWMTPGLLNSYKKKNTLYRTFLAKPSAYNKSKFISYRNKFKRIKEAAITNYYSTKFCEYENNGKKTWDLLKRLLSGNTRHPSLSTFYDSDCQPMTTPAEIANAFNIYFSSIGCDLARKIAPCCRHHREYLKNPVPQSMLLLNVIPDEIIQISRSLKQFHSTGLDQIDPSLAKISVPVIAHVLAAIINCSLNSGVFPDALKIAKVIPLHKSDSRENILNYRPISILPYFSKFFEKTMFNRTSSFLEKFSVIKENQFGFRKGKPIFVKTIRHTCQFYSYIPRYPMP